MNTDKARPASSASRQRDDPRDVLRAFAEFCERTEPRALAAQVDNGMVAKTLAHVAKIDLWFKHYCTELRERRVQ